MTRQWFRITVLAGIVIAAGTIARAQELEPRAYSPSPLGTNFLGVAVGTSSGDVLFDPTVPISDASAKVDLGTLIYGRTYGVFGRLGTVTIAVPVSIAHVTGSVGEDTRSVKRRGFADLRVRASVNLIGGRALTREEFMKAKRKTTLGFSLTVQAPTGQYEPTRLINLGTNRWAYKPELGLSVPVGRWTLEAYAGCWFFGDNDAFYPGASTKSEDPLRAVQAHFAYTFKNRAWLALNATWYGGGRTTIDDNPPSSPLSNSRIGGTFSLPLTAAQSIKLAASKGAAVRTGSDFTTFVAAWQIVLFDKPCKAASP